MLANFSLNAPCAGRVQCSSSRKLYHVWSEPRTFVLPLKICQLTPELARWEHFSVTQNSAGYGEKVQCVESSRCIWAVFVLFSREQWIAAVVWQKNIRNSRVIRRIVALGCAAPPIDPLSMIIGITQCHPMLFASGSSNQCALLGILVSSSRARGRCESHQLSCKNISDMYTTMSWDVVADAIHQSEEFSRWPDGPREME